MSTTTVLFRITFTRTIKLNLLSITIINHARMTCVTAFGNEITKVYKIKWCVRKLITKRSVVELRISWCVCGCFESHSTGKRRRNLWKAMRHFVLFTNETGAFESMSIIVLMKVIPSGCFKEEKRVPIICWLAINFAITNKEIRKLCLLLRGEINWKMILFTILWWRCFSFFSF